MSKYNDNYKPRPLTQDEIEKQLKKLEKETPTQKKKSKRRRNIK